MTVALCLNCGRTKFGALCPCSHCGTGATGNFNLDIAFSDHFMTDGSIEAFGKVIGKLREATDDQEVASWAFIVYVSQNHSDLLTAEPPPEMAERVSALLAGISLPKVELIRQPHREHAEGEGGFKVTFPPELFDSFRSVHGFDQIAAVEVLLRDGSVRTGCFVIANGPEYTLTGRGPECVETTDIVGIRPARGCIPLRRRPPWVRLDPDE